MKRTPEEILARFTYIYNSLVEDCHSYDSGKTDKAFDIAGRIRVLLHSKNRTTSALEHIKKQNILFYNSASNPSRSNHLTLTGNINLSNSRILINSDVYLGLVTTVISGEGKNHNYDYKPLFVNKKDFSSYEKKTLGEWWKNITIFKTGDISLTREKLILSVVEQDGVDHLDDELNPHYAKLLQKDWDELVINGKRISFPKNAVFATIRQIAEETIKTFKAELSDII